MVNLEAYIEELLTLTSLSIKADFFTSDMLQKFELSQRNMLLEYPKAIFLCLSVLEL